MVPTPSARLHPEPEETFHLLWNPDFTKWSLTTPLGPILSPMNCGTLNRKNDVRQLTAANSRQSTSINEAQSKHISEQLSELNSSSVCLPCRRERVTGVVPYEVI